MISHVAFARSVQVIHVSGELSSAGNVRSGVCSACGPHDGVVGIDSRTIDDECSHGTCRMPHMVRAR